MTKVNALPLEKLVTYAVVGTNLRKKNADLVDLSLSQDVTQEGGQIGPKEVVHTNAVYMEFALKNVEMTTQWVVWWTKSIHCFTHRNFVKNDGQMSH